MVASAELGNGSRERFDGRWMAGQGLMTILGAFVGVVVAESGRLRPSAAACAKTGSIGQMQTPAELIPIPDASGCVPDESGF